MEARGAWAKFAKHNPLAPDSNPFNDKVTIISFPIEKATGFFAATNGATIFNPVSPSPSQVRLAGVFWRYEAPGAGFTEYYREDPDDEEHEYLDGRIYRQVDENGNNWQYEYRAFTASTGVPSRPRLHRIYLNGTSLLNCAANLEFEWVTGTLSFPGSGKMRSVTVFRPTKPRPDSSVVWVPTQYAKYSYKNDGPSTYGHLNSGANSLILVEAGQLVNAPAVGQTVSLNDLMYHRRFTHYRYE